MPRTRQSNGGPRTASCRRRRPGALIAAGAALCVLAVGCGGAPANDPATAVATDDSDLGPLSQRPADGIRATGATLQPGPPCSVDAADAVKIAWMSPDLDELAAVGLETLIYDDPTIVVEAYIDTLNSQGGVNGHCLAFVEYVWGLEDPGSDFVNFCSTLPAQQPLVLIALALDDTTLQCATVSMGIPTLGLLTSPRQSMFNMAAERLFVDQGTSEHLVTTGLAVAMELGEISASDTVGLLSGQGSDGEEARRTVQATSGRLGLQLSAVAEVPVGFGDLGVLLAERQVGLLRTDLSDSEMSSARQALEQLSPETLAMLQSIEQFYLAEAERFAAAGVSVVVPAVGWSEVRRLMRAAAVVGWYPTWLINDSQPASLVLTETPRQQALNLVQVSSRRAAGDDIPQLDRDCVNMRNVASMAEPFSHRVHADAWNLVTDTCDFLDVLFGSMARVDGPPTREELVASLAASSYQTSHGSLIAFSGEDRFGFDRFRILRADPDCVLNEWGCMRASSRWLVPAGADAAQS